MDGTIFHQGQCPVEENGTVCILNFVGYSSNNQLVLVRIFVLKSPKKLKTLFNIVQAPLKNCRTLISVLYDDVQMDQ